MIRDIPTKLLEKMIACGVWSAECPVHYKRLKYVCVEYINFDGDLEVGHLVVFDIVAEYVVNIFQQLKQNKFPIHQIKTINLFGGSDELSMKSNNSSAFNYRGIAESDKLSIHSYGLAIDINPKQNPYIIKKSNEEIVFPRSGKEFLDRSKSFKGKISNKEVIIFKENKFICWGGEWKDPIDYQHFEIPRIHAERLIKMSYDDGKSYLNSGIFS
ncbi:MAG: M15 family metallopeptidase [Rickettsiales bacterium]